MINIIEQTFFPDGGSNLRDNKDNVYTFDEIYQLYLEDLAYRELRVRQVNDEFKTVDAGNGKFISLNDIRYIEEITDSVVKDALENKIKALSECLNRRNSWYKSSTYYSEDNVDCYIDENDTINNLSSSKEFICKQPEHRGIGHITYINKHYLTKDKDACLVGSGNLKTDIYRHKGHVSSNKYLIIVEDGKAGFTFYSWFIIEYLNRKANDTGDIEIHSRSADGFGGVNNILEELSVVNKYKGVLVITDYALDFVGKSKVKDWTSDLININGARVALFAPLSLEFVAYTFRPMIICNTGIGDFNPAFFNDIADSIDRNVPIVEYDVVNNKYTILMDKYIDIFKVFDKKGIKKYGKTVENEFARYLDGYNSGACYSYKKGNMGFPWMHNCCKLGNDVNSSYKRECASLQFKGSDKVDLWLDLKYTKRLILFVEYVIMGIEFDIAADENGIEWRNK